MGYGTEYVRVERWGILMGKSELGSLLQWLRDTPAGMPVDATVIADRIEGITGIPDPEPVNTPEWTWRERFWTCPPETRIGTNELCEAVNRPRSWLYRHTGDGGSIPRRKFDGELVFIVGEVQKWLIDHEEVIVKGSTTPFVVPIKRRALGG